jgi:excisionase family DNA binding protein
MGPVAMDLEKYKTPMECAKYFNIHVTTVYRHYRRGKLTFMQIGAKTYVDMETAAQCFAKEPRASSLFRNEGVAA